MLSIPVCEVLANSQFSVFDYIRPLVYVNTSHMYSLKITHMPDVASRLIIDTRTMELLPRSPRSNGTHILLADRQPKVRFALRVLLERHPNFVVVGAAVNADDLVSQTKAKRPDLI
jgi:hypothetical protein